MKATDAAGLLVERVHARPWEVAVAAISGGDVSTQIDAGQDPLDTATTFQWGSITKTMTGVLVAYAVEAGELSTDSALGDLLGVSGQAAAITVGELVTQSSGLPRLPPNLDPSTVDQTDPYASYTVSDLLEALAQVDIGPKEYTYSNFGFMVLGRILSEVGGASYADLLQHRLLDPLRMSSTGCPPPEPGRVRGYSGPQPTPWWTTQLPGSGGVGGSIVDLATYLQAHLAPPEGALGVAIHDATTIHAEEPTSRGYGWAHEGGGWWHNGGTGGFRSFVAFHRPTGTAVALLANSAQADVVDSVGFATLTEMVKDASDA